MTEPQNILFLDFDKVINCEDGSTPHEHVYIFDEKQTDIFSKKLARNVSKLIKDFNFAVVISSSWRKHYPFSILVFAIRYMGIEGPIIDVTELTATNRSDQILSWLNKTDIKIKNYFILDDSEDVVYDHPNHYFLVDPYTGFDLNSYQKCHDQILNFFN